MIKFKKENKELLIQKLLNPYYQTDIDAFNLLMQSLNLKIKKKDLIKIIYDIGLLPLDKDPLKQKRLLLIVRDIMKYGYRKTAQEILNLIKKDQNLCVCIGDFIDEKKGT